jgi:hypothetical protein
MSMYDRFYKTNDLELEVVQPIYVQENYDFCHDEWLAIEDVDIFHHCVSTFS